MFFQESRSRCHGFHDMFDELLLVKGWVVAIGTTLGIGGIVGQGLPQGFHDAHIVDDEAVGLTLGNAVGTGDGLHQRVGFHGFVDVEARKSLHVETSEPHGTDKDDAELRFAVFELLVKLAFLHLLAM